MRVMIDLAEQRSAGFVPLKEIAGRQDISQKYLESIMADLSKAGLLEGQHGKGGGYRLNRDPGEYSVGEILRLTEGDLAPVACLEENAKSCPRISSCKTIKMWKDFYAMTNDYFDGITLADLTTSDGGDNYII